MNDPLENNTVLDATLELDATLGTLLSEDFPQEDRTRVLQADGHRLLRQQQQQPHQRPQPLLQQLQHVQQLLQQQLQQQQPGQTEPQTDDSSDESDSLPDLLQPIAGSEEGHIEQDDSNVVDNDAEGNTATLK